jgi:hypothetical protein
MHLLELLASLRIVGGLRILRHKCNLHFTFLTLTLQTHLRVSLACCTAAAIEPHAQTECWNAGIGAQ